jgi:hypothetical protein
MSTTQPRTNGRVHAPPPVEGVEEMVAAARRQLARIDPLFACRRPHAKRCAERYGIPWTPDILDPEYRKTLRNLSRLMADAEGICRRRGLDASQLAELAEAVRLPQRAPLTIEVLLARRFRLEALLIDLGDEKYLRERAAAYWMERDEMRVRWATMYPRRVPPILEGIRRENGRSRDEVAERTRQMLQQLVAAKHYDDIPMRRANELALRALRLIAPVVLLASVAFALAIADVTTADTALQVAAAAGATGAALGTLIKVRDRIVPGVQYQQFLPFFLAQVTVGATAGMLTFLADEAGMITIGGGVSGLAALSFALGFTEAAFLRLIARVGDLAGGGATPTPPPDSAD